MIRSLLPSIRHVLAGYAILPKYVFLDADEKGVRCIETGKSVRVEKRLPWENFRERKGSFRTLSVAVCTEQAILEKLTRDEQVSLFRMAVAEKRLPGYYTQLIQRCRNIPEEDARLLAEAAEYIISQ